MPAAAENALDKIRDLYWAKGYNDVRSDYDLVQDRATGQVDVTFTITEGRQSVIAGITIEGNDKVSDHLVQRADSAGHRPAARSRARWRARAGISTRPARSRSWTSLAATSRATRGRNRRIAQRPTAEARSTEHRPSQQKPVEINVQVREVQPIQIRYGASYDTERGLGGIFDISNRNSLGEAREIGLQSRYDRQLHDGRLYINQPALTYLPKTTGAIYFREELNPPTELTDPFDTSRKGASIQQEKKLRDLYVRDLRLQARTRPHADACRATASSSTRH